MQKQKTVFLTGANGDIGRQLLKKFSKSGFKIICAISNKKKNIIGAEKISVKNL